MSDNGFFYTDLPYWCVVCRKGAIYVIKDKRGATYVYACSPKHAEKWIADREAAP